MVLHRARADEGTRTPNPLFTRLSARGTPHRVDLQKHHRPRASRGLRAIHVRHESARVTACGYSTGSPHGYPCAIQPCFGPPQTATSPPEATSALAQRDTTIPYATRPRRSDPPARGRCQRDFERELPPRSRRATPMLHSAQKGRGVFGTRLMLGRAREPSIP